MGQPSLRSGPPPCRVSIVALPDAAVSTLYGIFDVMSSVGTLVSTGGDATAQAPFRVKIVGESVGPMRLASGVPISVNSSIDDIDDTDVLIVPSIVLGPDGWQCGRYPRLVDWIGRVYEGGALLCSACSGIFLLAETGAFDGKDVTVHYGYADALTAAFPSLRSHPERVLVITGLREELITSGASATWHDLVLYLIARFSGATVAQAVARQFALQWHADGLTPYMVFEGRVDHGDGEIESAQRWLGEHFAVANPVDEVIKRSKLAARTFKRRFAAATGLTPMEYVQRLRIEDGKRRLERTEASIDEVSWRVGYEDAAFFRRLFKRITGLTPGAYRKRFRIPEFARAGQSTVTTRNQDGSSRSAG